MLYFLRKFLHSRAIITSNSASSAAGLPFDFRLPLLLHLDHLPDASKHRSHDIGLGHAKTPSVVYIIDAGEVQLVFDLSEVCGSGYMRTED